MENSLLNLDYKRRDNESRFEHGLRLIQIKIENNPDDLDWQDIIEILNLNLHRDSLRKACQTEFGGYSVMKYFKEKIIKEKITDINVLDEIELKKIELEKERIKLGTIKQEYNKWKRQDARLELFFDEIQKSIKTIDVPEFTPIQINDSKERIGLLGVADFHYGKVFSSINNKYSEEIFYERMNKLLYETVELCKEQNISQLHVLNMGDDIEGMTLRISQLMSLQSGMIDQVIKLARYMAKFLNELSKYVEITYHHVLCGNHSEVRAFNDKTFTYENMERVIIAYIRDVLQNNPRINIPEYNGKFVDFKIFNYNIYAQHGQKVKNPKKIIADASQLHRKFFDVSYFGHMHHEIQMTTNEAKTHDCEVVYVPSIMGSDEYSDDNYFGGSKASAKLDIYEEGKCRKASFKILLN